MMSSKITQEISEAILETLLSEIMKDGKFEGQEKDCFNKLYKFLKVKKDRFLEIKKQVQDRLVIHSKHGSLDHYVLLEKIHKSFMEVYDESKTRELMERIALILNCTDAFDKLIAKLESVDTSPQTLYEQALALEEGKGVKQDLKKALKNYDLAASQGYGKAQQNLAYLYFMGLGTEKNSNLAFKWYKMAAEQELPVAELNLGNCFALGRGVSQSHTEASHWYEKSAKQGNAKAQFNLGYNYLHGQGVEQSYQEAIRWYTEAANQGALAAQHNLGLIYFEGQGVEQDHRQAMLWFGRAAASDYAPSQACLDQMKQALERSTEN
jgi:hypothetical protein